jgi:phenylpyruvate tautomerase PptA (4-oxalocrotonate tautomerase family)
MPICFIEAPQGIRLEAKKKLVENATAAIHEAYPIPDTRIFIREYAGENVGQDGKLQSEIRPVCFLDVPEGIDLNAKRTLVRKLNAALAEAMPQTREHLIFFRAYPLSDAAADGRLQSENPAVLEAMAKMNA